jgi:hypothetical protein
MNLALDMFIKQYEYKHDPKGRDQWRVLTPDADGKFRGDCEDFALSVLYYVICHESWLKFWWLLLTGKAKLCYVMTKNDVGHAVLRYDDMYIDNWTKDWVHKAYMKSLGHEFHGSLFSVLHVAVRMLKAKLRARQ